MSLYRLTRCRAKSPSIGLALTVSAFALLGLQSPAYPQIAQHLTQAEAYELFRSANDSCIKEDNDICVKGYERLLGEGFGSADLEYNLGTAYLRQEKLGPAVLHLERALRINASDSDARANLEQAKKKRVDRLVGAPEESSGDESLLTRVVSYTSCNRWGLAFAVLWALGGAGLVLYFSTISLKKSGLAIISVAMLTASIPCGAVTGAHAFMRSTAREAIVVQPSVAVREGPNEKFKALFEVHEALKVRVLDQEGSFKHVRLANGLEGWLPAESTVEISPK